MARRGRHPSLTREQVVDAALALADEIGVDALSMPRLARELGCGTMTLYGYVADKHDLLDALAQRALAGLRLEAPPRPDPAGLLIAWGRALRATLRAHPSLPLLFLQRPVVAPGILLGVERLLTALARYGMPPRWSVRAVYAVLTYTTGFVAWELARADGRPGPAYAETWRRELARMDPSAIPLTSTALDDLVRVAQPEQFELGLGALAEGLLRSHSAPAVSRRNSGERAL